MNQPGADRPPTYSRPGGALRRLLGLLLAAVLVSALLPSALTQPASASTITTPTTTTWTLKNVTFADGAVATGSFDVDAAGRLHDIDVATTGGSALSDFHYVATLGPYGASGVVLAASEAGRIFRYLRLTPAQNLLGVAPGTEIALATASDHSYECMNCNPYRLVTAGSLVASGGSVDTSAPVVSSQVSPAIPDGAAGWYRDATPEVSFHVEDPESVVTSTTGCASTTVETDTAGTTLTCSATSTGGTGSTTVTLRRDATAPFVSGSDVTDATWRTAPLTHSFTASDATSGLLDAADATFDLTAAEESADAETPTVVSRTVRDVAGNSSTRTLTAFIDRTDPVPALVGGPLEGQEYFTTTVPAAPACAATDVPSGVLTCVVDGYGTTAGSHTVTATATDRAGNSRAVTSSYTVREMTSTAFAQPVDTGDVLNVVKGGSTVALRFAVQVDGVPQTSTGVVAGFTTTRVACATGTAEETLEIITTGGTSLRYDVESSRFVQNWKTPSAPGTCYRASATLADGESVSALFKLR